MRYQELLQRHTTERVLLPTSNGLKRSPAPVIDLTLEEDELEKLHPRKKARTEDLNPAPKTLYPNHKYHYLNSRSKSPNTGYKFFKTRNLPFRKLFSPFATPSHPSAPNSILTSTPKFTASGAESPAASSLASSSFSKGISSPSTPMMTPNRDRVTSSGFTSFFHKFGFGKERRNSLPDEKKPAFPQLPNPSFIEFKNESESDNLSPLLNTEWLKDLKEQLQHEETDRKIESMHKKAEERRRDRVDEFKKFKHLVTSVTIPTIKPFVPEPEPEEEPTIEEFPELTPDMDSMIDDALISNNLNANEVLCTGFDIDIRRKDMNTLDGLNWLNDEVCFAKLGLCSI